jgi:hypothetical protein
MSDCRRLPIFTASLFEEIRKNAHEKAALDRSRNKYKK